MMMLTGAGGRSLTVLVAIFAFQAASSTAQQTVLQHYQNATLDKPAFDSRYYVFLDASKQKIIGVGHTPTEAWTAALSYGVRNKWAN